MARLPQLIRAHDFFLRRREILALGVGRAELRDALACHEVIRVRQGWYSIAGAPDAAIRAVRVGGRLTGRSALLSYGIDVPRPRRLQIVVKSTDARIRDPESGQPRRCESEAVDLRWTDAPDDPWRSPWRMSMPDALLEVLKTESRDIAIACCDLVINARAMSLVEVERVFSAAPGRVRRWFAMVDGRAAAFGETFVRLWLADDGIRFVPQPYRRGVGYLDGQISRRTFVEIDGSQHAQEGWRPRRDATADELAQMETDHRRDAVLATNSERSLRFTYRLLLREWSLCLAAMRQAVADDELVTGLEASAARQHERRRIARERRLSRDNAG